MNTCIKLNPENKSTNKKLIAFLAEFDLSYEKLDSLFVVENSSGDWLASGGRAGGVLKGFAVRDEYRSEGLFDMILSSLLTEAYKQGIHTLYVFTKNEYSQIFKSFAFVELAHTNVSSLLMRSDISIDQMLDDLDIDVVADDEVGAIVMNANPFTNGHKYLVETASKKVDDLIVFVVQSDASQFSYDDRMKLVKLGTAMYKNVHVVPSTDLIVSQATFPSYFLKEKELISSEHAKIDAMVFKKYFVPKFGIDIRFLGTEPTDASTAIYNEVLSGILPPECKVEIIERLQSGDYAVSASVVRRLLKEGRMEEIKELVPQATFDYLSGK